MENLEKQIRETYYKAFYDRIDETVASQSADYQWILSLYVEIKMRLLRYVKKGSKTYNAIDESFDVKLFEQMIINDVFDKESMFKLVNNTFYWIGQLQAPFRDIELEESKQRVLLSREENRVSTFVKEVNENLDKLDDDMKKHFTKK